MYRDKLEDLIAWKNDKNRKPLILIGARQVILENSRVMEWNFGSDTKNAPGKWSGWWGVEPITSTLGSIGHSFNLTLLPPFPVPSVPRSRATWYRNETQVLVKFCKNSMNLKK